MKLQLQVNSGFKEANSNLVTPTGGIILMTPPLNPEYWLMRVPVSEKQAVVCFPKMMTIGIGFQVEEADWNTNLPYSIAAREIFDHIAKNKIIAGDVEISDEDCIKAIEMLQAAIKEIQNQ